MSKPTVTLSLTFELAAARLLDLLDALKPFVNEATYSHFGVTREADAVVTKALAKVAPEALPDAPASEPEAPAAEAPKRGRPKKAEEAPKTEVPAKAAAPAPAAAPAKTVTLDDVRSAAMKAIQKVGQDTVDELLSTTYKTFNVTKLSEVKEADRPRLLAMLQEL